jgi:DNA polymerase
MQDSQDSEQAYALLEMLAWYRAMGVDAATGTMALDWLARGAAAPGEDFVIPLAIAHEGATSEGRAGQLLPAGARVPETGATRVAPNPPSQDSSGLAPAQPPPSMVRPIQSSGAFEIAARQAAREARTLVELEQALAKFDGCPLKAMAKNLCFYRGAPRSRLMLIGEAPGREEDLSGKPFVGRAGQLLDKMLAAAGFSETEVHITNIIYWRPPGNRTPTPQEAEACRPFLERQVELVAPQFVVLLGGAAAKQMLGTDEGIMKLRGRWQELKIAGHACRAMATLHPAFLLRSPGSKRQAWRDMLAIRTEMNIGKATDH